MDLRRYAWPFAGLLLLAGTGLLDALGREGALVAGRPLSSLPAGLVPAAALLAALVAPRRRKRRSVQLGLGVLLVALVATWWYIDGWGQRARNAALPLVGTLRPLDGGPEVPATVPLKYLPRRYQLTEALGRSGGFAMELDGELVTPEDGRYGLALRCPETCSVALDGYEVLRVPGNAETQIALRSGVLALHLELQAEGRAFLNLTWRRPTWLELAPLKQAAGSGVSIRDFRSLERSALVRTLLLALTWACVGLTGLSLASALAGWRGALIQALRRRWSQPTFRHAFAVGVATTLTVVLLRGLASRNAPDGLHVHEWTGEYLMQTVSAADLKVEPLRSLFYLHIQPPALDALRALSAQRHGALDGLPLVDAVDRDIYLAWAVAAGLLAALVYTWLVALVGRRAALCGTALFALHPAFLFYATFLDSTFLSSVGLCWASYELWRLSTGAGRPGRLALALSLLFLTRSVVQWPFLLVLALALWLIGVDRRRALRAFLPFALVMVLYTVKQYSLFGLVVTSSFAPINLCNGLLTHCPGNTPVELPSLPPPEAASVLRRVEKLDGEYNWNQLAFLRRSFSQMAEYKTLLRATPPQRILRLAAHSATFWLKPSSRLSAHILVDDLPWRGLYDAVLSGLPLVLLLAAGAAVALVRAGPTWPALRRGLGLALPAIYVATVTIVFESGENMRLKFFVEPLIWIFLWTQASAVVRAARRRLATAA